MIIPYSFNYTLLIQLLSFLSQRAKNQKDKTTGYKPLALPRHTNRPTNRPSSCWNINNSTTSNTLDILWTPSQHQAHWLFV